MDHQKSILTEASFTKQISQLNLKPIHTLQTSLCFVKDNNNLKNNISFGSKAIRSNRQFLNPDTSYTPGPGKYQSILDISYMTTNYLQNQYSLNNKKIPPFGTTFNRFDFNTKKLGPAPNQYQIQNNLNKPRATVFSPTVDLQRNTFLNIRKQNIPGPGNYLSLNSLVKPIKNKNIKQKNAHQILTSLNCTLKKKVEIPSKKKQNLQNKPPPQSSNQQKKQNQNQKTSNFKENKFKNYSIQKLQRFKLRQQTNKLIQNKNELLNNSLSQNNIFQKSGYGVSDCGVSYYFKQSNIKGSDFLSKINQNPGPGSYFWRQHKKRRKERLSPVFNSNIPKGLNLSPLNKQEHHNILSYVPINRSFGKGTLNFNNEKKWI